MLDRQMREFARVGALELARRAVIEFPDILPELNRMANGQPARQIGRPRKNAPIGTDAVALRTAFAVPPDATVAAAVAAHEPKKPRRKRSRISAKGRRAISRAMKLRWKRAHAAAKKAGA